MKIFESRRQTSGEELANAISHGVALIAAVVAAIFLISGAAQAELPEFVGIAVFSVSMICLYAASTIYHGCTSDERKQFFDLLDHCAIYILIAGTYTPLAISVLEGYFGLLFLALVWTLAIAGISLKCFGRLKNSATSTAYYLLMGWLVLLIIEPLRQALPAFVMKLLIAGGAAYTFGVFFYAAKQIRYGHLVWHLTIVVGTTFHFVAVALITL